MNRLFRTTVVEISGVRTIAGGGTNASNAGQALLNLSGVSITGNQFISGNKIFGTNNISRSTFDNAAILGGTNNTITGGVSNSFIANGQSNTISGSTVESSILNGLSNIIFQGDGSSVNSNILGGALNSIQQGFYSSILHGTQNSIGAPGVPFQNFSQACSSSIINGSNNKIIGTFNLIGGGSFNTITGIASFNEGLCQTTSRSNAIVGGANNSILNSSCSAILGGRYNEVNHNGATIIGDGSLNVKTSRGACTLLMSFANGIYLESPLINYTGTIDGNWQFNHLPTVNGTGVLLSGSNLIGSPVEYVAALSDETSDLTTGLAKFTFRAPVSFKLTNVAASVNTSPSGSAIIIDINNDTNPALSTKLSIDSLTKTSFSAATGAVINSTYENFPIDREITIDIDQIGAGSPGKGLKVVLRGVRS